MLRFFFAYRNPHLTVFVGKEQQTEDLFIFLSYGFLCKFQSHFYPSFSETDNLLPLVTCSYYHFHGGLLHPFNVTAIRFYEATEPDSGTVLQDPFYLRLIDVH